MVNHGSVGKKGTLPFFPFSQPAVRSSPTRGIHWEHAVRDRTGPGSPLLLDIPLNLQTDDLRPILLLLAHAQSLRFHHVPPSQT